MDQSKYFRGQHNLAPSSHRFRMENVTSKQEEVIRRENLECVITPELRRKLEERNIGHGNGAYLDVRLKELIGDVLYKVYKEVGEDATEVSKKVIGKIISETAEREGKKEFNLYVEKHGISGLEYQLVGKVVEGKDKRYDISEFEDQEYEGTRLILSGIVKEETIENYVKACGSEVSARKVSRELKVYRIGLNNKEPIKGEEIGVNTEKYFSEKEIMDVLDN